MIVIAVCTFFGHRDTISDITALIKSVVVDLIENQNVDMFYVGNNGGFDRKVIKVLEEVYKEFPHIDYAVVLAYLPTTTDTLRHKDYEKTIYPEGLEQTPPKFAILKRNRWMVENSDFVIAYVKRGYGGAAQFVSLAQRKGKKVINLAEIKNQLS